MWNAVRKWAVFKRRKKKADVSVTESRADPCLSVPYGKWIQTEGQEHSSMFLANTSSPLYFLPFGTNESLSLQITCDHRFKLALLGFCEWGFLTNSTVPFYFKLLWFLLCLICSHVLLHLCRNCLITWYLERTYLKLRSDIMTKSPPRVKKALMCDVDLWTAVLSCCSIHCFPDQDYSLSKAWTGSTNWIWDFMLYCSITSLNKCC